MPDEFSPDAWLTSLLDAFQDYIETRVNEFILDDLGNPAGLEAYEVIMQYPEADDLPKSAEFQKTIIHLEIDDADNQNLGFGPGIVAAAEAPLPDGSTEIEGHEGRSHVLNFDIGVWASDESGGTTSRARAYEMLDLILNGDKARRDCFEATGGIEIRYFNSGRFVKETINDIRVFRVVGAELEVRVFSRSPIETSVVVDGEPIQTPVLEIGGTPLED